MREKERGKEEHETADCNIAVECTMRGRTIQRIKEKFPTNNFPTKNSRKKHIHRKVDFISLAKCMRIQRATEETEFAPFRDVNNNGWALFARAKVAGKIYALFFCVCVSFSGVFMLVCLKIYFVYCVLRLHTISFFFWFEILNKENNNKMKTQ